MSIGDRVFRVARQKRITSAQLAASVGVTATTVRQWLRGRSIPYNRLPQVAEALNVSEAFLLTGEDDSTIEAQRKQLEYLTDMNNKLQAEIYEKDYLIHLLVSQRRKEQ